MPINPAVPYTPIGEPIDETIPHDGLNFYTVTWKVPKDVEEKGKIIYVHGFAEHSDIYTEFFDKLSQTGYEIFFFDQRGAGATSPGKLRGKSNEYHTFEDLEFMIQNRSEKYPGTKFYLLGHSMGGGIVLNYGIKGRNRDKIRGLAVSAPLVLLHPKTQPNILLRGIMPVVNSVYPDFIVDSKLVYDYVTSNQKWLDFIKNDKLIGSASLFYGMISRGRRLTDPEYAGNFDKNIPLLVMHGDRDYINSVDGSKKFIELLPNDVNKEVLVVEGARHSLFIENDEIFAGVYSKLLEFLGKN